MKGLLIKDFKLMKNNMMFLVMIIIISIGCAAGMKNPFFAELLNEKEGLKLLKKAQKNKKYTINEDFIYEAK